MLLSGIKKAHFELQLITGALWATLELRITPRLVSADNLRNTVDDQRRVWATLELRITPELTFMGNLRIADSTKAGF